MAEPKKHIIHLPELDNEAGEFQLKLETRKHFTTGSIVSTAHGQHAKDGLVIYELCGDFNKIYQNNRGPATQKRIDAQHEQVFNPIAIGDIIKEVKEFYARKAEANRQEMTA